MPAKSCYTFNMQDVFKVLQGICQCMHESLPEGYDLANVWYHAELRGFRLPDAQSLPDGLGDGRRERADVPAVGKTWKVGAAS